VKAGTVSVRHGKVLKVLPDISFATRLRTADTAIR
jgi:hypothetical protein